VSFRCGPARGRSRCTCTGSSRTRLRERANTLTQRLRITIFHRHYGCTAFVCRTRSYRTSLGDRQKLRTCEALIGGARAPLPRAGGPPAARRSLRLLRRRMGRLRLLCRLRCWGGGGSGGIEGRHVAWRGAGGSTVAAPAAILPCPGCTVVKHGSQREPMCVHAS
jgi:hypothetical protein